MPQHPAVLAAATKSPSPTPSPTRRPAARVTPTPRTSSAVHQTIGIAGNLAPLSPAQLNQRLDEVASLGVTWVRYDLEWSNVEYAGPGKYDWSSYDRVVQAVAAHKLHSLVILDYTPAWARRSDCSDTSMCAPADPGAYARFAGAAAARYRGQGVQTWEIWNEPNNQQFFQPAANVGQYVALLNGAYAAIKQADPSATVITGGTSPADTADGSIAPPDFVRGLYAAGARGHFDALGVHPYTWPFSPAWNNPDGAWGQMVGIHNLMVAAGDGAKPIWMTEFGAPTGGPGRLASSGMTWAEGGDDHVTEALQARILTDAVTMASRVPWLGPLFWYSYQDAGTSSDTVENFFGLVRQDGGQKPAYGVFRDLVQRYH